MAFVRGRQRQIGALVVAVRSTREVEIKYSGN